jgi:hypothetical protein
LPEIRLANGHRKARITGPLNVLLFLRVFGLTVGKGLDRLDILKSPNLSYGEGAIRVFASLVYLNAPHTANCEDDEALLLILCF